MNDTLINFIIGIYFFGMLISFVSVFLAGDEIINIDKPIDVFFWPLIFLKYLIKSIWRIISQW